MMGKDRAPIFDDGDDFDLSSFKPKAVPDTSAASPDQISAVAERANFPSRQPKPAAPVAPPATPVPKRVPRRHRTGRTAPLSARTTPATLDLLYAIADAQGWLVGQTIEKALDALQRELQKPGRA